MVHPVRGVHAVHVRVGRTPRLGAGARGVPLPPQEEAFLEPVGRSITHGTGNKNKFKKKQKEIETKGEKGTNNERKKQTGEIKICKSKLYTSKEQKNRIFFFFFKERKTKTNKKQQEAFRSDCRNVKESWLYFVSSRKCPLLEPS